MAILLLIGVVIIAAFALIVVLIVSQERGGSGVRTIAKYSSQGYGDRFYRTDPGFDSEQEEREDCDGTPYGAIDDLLMDADGDGDWDDFDDGVPDDWD